MRMSLCGLGRVLGLGIESSGFREARGAQGQQGIFTRLREMIWSMAVAERLLVGKLRRFYLVHMRKAYVSAKLSSRKGNCRQCGVCCSFLFKCPALNGQGLCRVYNSCRWKACTVFPLDERDLLDVAVSGGSCGYFWKEP